MAKASLLKDHINPEAVRGIARAFSQAMPDFDSKRFIREATMPLANLELKQRVRHVMTCLHAVLPDDFAETAPLLQAVKNHWPEPGTKGWSSFAAWPVIDYAGEYGLDHPELALPALKTLTPLFTAEFALRPFLRDHFDITYHHLQEWCQDDDEHVRRLVSEGTRPRLPWGIRLQQLCSDPSPAFPLLEQLKADQSLYVRKSVANHLNDISKDNPAMALALCRQWKSSYNPDTQWIIRHATRNLVKAGDQNALALLGFTGTPALRIENFLMDQDNLKLGDDLDFSFDLHSTAKSAQKLVIDYAIHHVRANGTRSAKVFKLRNIDIKKGDVVRLSRRHPFRHITTRRYYTGTHRLEILANGISLHSLDFRLTV